MEFKRMTVQECEIEYLVEGDSDKECILFAHGLGASLKQWLDQIEFFKKTNRVVALSFQGHGNSSRHDEAKFYAIEQYANVAIHLLNQLEIKKCTWVGCSMGGVIGYEVLKKQASLIERLVTFGTTPELKMPTFTINVIKLLDKFLIKLMGFEKYINFVSNNSSKLQSVQKQLKDIMLETHPNAIVESHGILGNYSYLNDIKELDKKIYIIQGSDDKDINKYINKNINLLNINKNISFKRLESAGHIANLDQPQEFNRLLSEILFL